MKLKIHPAISKHLQTNYTTQQVLQVYFGSHHDTLWPEPPPCAVHRKHVLAIIPVTKSITCPSRGDVHPVGWGFNVGKVEQAFKVVPDTCHFTLESDQRSPVRAAKN